MGAEEWRQIAGFEGVYSVSSAGRVRREAGRVPNGTDGRTRPIKQLVLAQAKDGSGYLTVHLHLNRTRRALHVASLVAEAFNGPRPTGMDVCHNNGDKTDNRAENLRYDTRKGNMADRLKHGTHIQGERHAAAKLSVADIRAIRADTRTYAQICVDYGITFQHVGAIKVRKAWKHVT